MLERVKGTSTTPLPIIYTRLNSPFKTMTWRETVTKNAPDSIPKSIPKTIPQALAAGYHAPVSRCQFYNGTRARCCRACAADLATLRCQWLAACAAAGNRTTRVLPLWRVSPLASTV